MDVPAVLVLSLLTLSQAVRLATEHHPAVTASTAEADAAEAAIAEVSAARRPSVSLDAHAVRHSDPMPATPIHGFSLGNLPPFDRTLVQSALTASYVLYDAGARQARIDESTHYAAAARAEIENRRQEIAAQTVATYLTILTRREILDAHDQRLLALEAEKKRVAALEQVGRVPRVEVLRIEAAHAAAGAERTEVAAALDAAERALAELTGESLEATRASQLAPVGSGRHEPHRETIENTETPLLEAARARAAARESAIGAARGARMPSIAASASQLLFATPDALLADEWNAGVHLHFNVFDFGATAARIARATAMARAATAQAEALELERGIAIDRALADLEQNRANAEGLRTAATRFEEVARIEKLKLDNGAGTQTDYLRAEADLVAARASLAAARWRIALAQVEIARLSGTLTAEWIEEQFR